MTNRTRPKGFEALEISAGARSIEDLQKLQDRENELTEKLGHLAEGTPEYKRASMERENARIRKEIFLWEHDSTGAWKGDRYGRDVSEMLQRMEFSAGTEGAVFGEGKKGSMFIVNMGELDRANDVSHKLGDQALTELRMRISREVEESLGNKADGTEVNVYRIASNDFAVTFEGLDDPEMIRRIKRSLESQLFEPNAERQTRGEEEIEAARGVEGLPLAVTECVSFDQVGKIYDRLPKEPRPSDPDSLEIWERKQRTDWIDCLKEIGQVFSDFEKTKNRVTRLAEKIGREEPDSKNVYTKYLQKSVGGLFRGPDEAGAQTYEQFSASLRGHGAFDPAKRIAWESALFAASMEDSMRQFFSRSAEKQDLARAIADHARIGFEKRAAALNTQIADDFRGAFEPSPKEARTSVEIGADALSEFDARLDSREAGFGPTDGELLLREKRIRIDALDGRIASSSDEQEKADLTLEKEHEELDLRLLLAKRDGRLGLGLRGTYFESLKQRVAEGAPVSVIAMDMAFLKYFDRDGGTKTGDRGIRAAGRILDAVTRSMRETVPDLHIEAFRKGGDEFNMLVGSTDAKVLAEVQRMIRLKTIDLGPIPADEGGTGAYLPTELQFNVGVASSEDPGAGTDPDRVADELDHLADGAIGPDKAVNRYVFLLLKRIRAERIQDPEERKKQEAYITNLTDRSEKALVGGSRKILDFAKQLLEHKEDILTSGKTAEDVARSIVDLVKESIEKEKTEQESLGKDVESAFAHQLEVALLQLHAEELIRKLEDAQERNAGLEKTIRELRSAVAEAMTSKEKVASLRERIQDSRI